MFVGPAEPSVAIDQSNAPDLAVAATEGAKQAVNSDDLPQTLPIGPSSGLVGLRTVLSKNLTSRESDIFSCTEVGAGSGNIVANLSDDLRTFIITYACSDISGSFSGRFNPNFESWTSFTGQYDNFVVYGTAINGNISCNNTGSVSRPNLSCTYGFSGIDGLNGVTFSTSNVAVSGNNSTGYSITATVNDPTTGAINFSTTNLTFSNCAHGVPNSGTLELTGLNGTSATVTYNDCNSFTLMDARGTTTVYNWADLAA